MSTSRRHAKEDDLDINISISQDGKSELEGEATSEQDIRTSTVLDNSKVVGAEGVYHDNGVRASTEVQNLVSESKTNVTHEITDSSSKWKSPYDSSNCSSEGAKVGSDVTGDNGVKIHQDDCSPPSLTGLTAEMSPSPETKVPKGGTAIIELSNTLPVDLGDTEDFVYQPELTNSSTIIQEAIETLVSKDDEPPPVPFSLQSHIYEDGLKSKHNEAVENLDSMDDEGLPVPFMISFADSTITEKWSRGNDAEGAAVNCANTIAHLPSAAEAVCQITPEDSFNQEVIPRARDSSVFSPSIDQGASNLEGADWNSRPQTIRNGCGQEEEEKENDISIPEAVPVRATSPADDPDVEVAELVEPDQNMMSLKKRHVFVILVLIATVILALGLTVNFTRRNADSTELLEASLTLQPSPQPSVVLMSSQRALSIRNEIENNVLRRNVTFDGIEETNSRVFALDWIINEDQMRLVSSDSNLFQRFILVLLAFEFSISDWLSDSNECSWLGVECDMNGHVVKVELTGNGLDGTMPPEISRLQYLQDLLLSDNSFYGTLPSEVGDLTDLVRFSIDRNNFTSTLPSEIANLKELIEFSLIQNEFTGNLPFELGNLSKLTNFSIKRNLFEGTLPPELGRLKDLTLFNLRFNNFTGTLPSEIGSLSTLSKFYFDSNQFSGSLPSEIGSLSNLTRFYAAYNRFTGTIPSELGSLHRLDRIILDGNQFSGTFPSELCNLKNLTHLWVYDNKLTGTLPTQLGNLEKLQYLITSQNQITGTIPTEVGYLKELFFLRFNENQMTGTIPTEIGGLKMLKFLYIFTNKFSGTIPSVLQNLTSLEDFSIYSNQFTGTLPSWLGSLDKLSMLYVSANQLTGTLPSELALLTNLTRFGVDLNNFTGTVPSWIGDLRDLSILWLDNNQFTGTFPSEIANNLNLEDFCIRNNNFSGSLPAEIQTNWDCELKV